MPVRPRQRVRVFVPPSHGFRLPACGDALIIMIGPGMGFNRNEARMPSFETLPAQPPNETEVVAEPCSLVIFGASGDLARRMVLPALVHLAGRGLLPAGSRLLGFARTPMTDDAFRGQIRAAVQGGDGDPLLQNALPDFLAGAEYCAGDYNASNDYQWLANRLREIDREGVTGGRHLFYLATPPHLFPIIVERLAEAGLARRPDDRPEAGWSRIVLEKPFGLDLESARVLQRQVTRAFDESEVYRIDHYLGKEAVQNLFAFRFGNAIFEPLWDRRYIESVQITAAETLGVEGRGGYYETSGALRDMIQNHLLQMLALVAMEPPSEWTATAVRDEKAKVLRAVEPLLPDGPDPAAYRGQYAAGQIDDEPVPAYRREPGVAADSAVETFVALRLEIANWRWSRVPFYLRTGKRLARRITEVAVQFRPTPHHSLGEQSPELARPNNLILHVTPTSGMTLNVAAKEPGPGMRLQPVPMRFCLVPRNRQPLPSAYEYLLLDAMRGDPTFFARWDEVETAWRIVTPLQEHWASVGSQMLYPYRSGSWGPQEADRLLRPGHRWRDLNGPLDCPS
jgi:glucose-6-phosphate 1-dehydrogenase